MGNLHHYVSGAGLNVPANGHGGNKHAFITSKGVLYTTYKSPSGGIQFWKSMDNGDTWIDRGIYGGGTVTCGAEYSVFLDELDNLHVTFAKYFGPTSDGRTDKAHIMYVHGYINADGNIAAWSPEMTITGYDYWHCPDLVAHEHNGQIRVHIMCNYNWAGDNRHITCYTRVVINNQDAANHVLEHQSFVHDVVGASTYPGKVSVELRHDGDGKTPQRLANGYRYPDILYTFTSSNLVHYGRIGWNGGNTWVAPSQQVVLDYSWGNIPSASNYTTYGGLYEHHRWVKTLYSPRDNQVVVVGWVGIPGFGQQALCIWEVPIGSATRNVAKAVLDWPGNGTYGLVSGSATLDPEGSVFAFGTVNWISQIGYLKIPRPKGSLVRNYTEYTSIDPDLPTADGARPSLLPYPQGEQHVFYLRSNNALVHWRANATCNVVRVGNYLPRAPAFRKTSTGHWVPVQSVAL